MAAVKILAIMNDWSSQARARVPPKSVIATPKYVLDKKTKYNQTFWPIFVSTFIKTILTYLRTICWYPLAAELSGICSDFLTLVTCSVSPRKLMHSTCITDELFTRGYKVKRAIPLYEFSDSACACTSPQGDANQGITPDQNKQHNISHWSLTLFITSVVWRSARWDFGSREKSFHFQDKAECHLEKKWFVLRIIYFLLGEIIWNMLSLYRASVFFTSRCVCPGK